MKKFFNLLFVAATAMVLTAGSVQAQNLSIDAKASSVKWFAKKVTGEHNGTISVASNSSLTIKDGNLISGKVIIDMGSMLCEDIKDAGYNKKLIDHLKSDDFFSVEKFKTATLDILKVTANKTDAGTHTISGNITIKGKTEAISFPATIKIEKGKLTGTGKLTIDRSKFDVRYGSKSFFDNLGDKMIYDEFNLDVTIVAGK